MLWPEGEVMEPFYIRQSAEPMDKTELNAWAEQCAAEARAQGAMHGRFSIHPTHPHLFLVEGWNASAKEVGDEGEPRWQLVEQS